jgi:hypothetical protein
LPILLLHPHDILRLEEQQTGNVKVGVDVGHHIQGLLNIGAVVVSFIDEFFLD